MFVMLPSDWLHHTFLFSKFLIKDQKAIDKILAAGFQAVEVDLSRSLVKPGEQLSPSRIADAQETVSILTGLRDDDKLSPHERAVLMYGHAVGIIQGLFELPSAEFIGESKRAIGVMVDTILHDDDTMSNLLRVCSHDEYTYTHSVNVGVYSMALAKKIYKRASDDQMRELGAGFFLHDLGKVQVDINIITKPGRLTDEEMTVMRQHPLRSFKILEEADQLSEECRVIALQHHEREDGTGYPYHLKGDEIHDFARICCIADVFDALTSRRSYKRSMTAFEALQLMKDEMLHHFHTEMFQEFVLLFAQNQQQVA